jgi:hypothetical protein
MAVVPLHQHPNARAIVQGIRDNAPRLIKRAERGGKRWSRFIDADYICNVFDFLCENENVGGELRAVVVNDSHFLAYSLGPMWFAPGHTWLIEQYFQRIGQGDTPAALTAIGEHAREQGACGVLIATMMAPDDDALGRIYTSAGYSRQCSQYLLETN